MLESRLEEISSELESLYSQIALYKKDKLTPSQGLLKAIESYEFKKETCKDSIKLWQDVRKVYPNYDR